MLIQVKMSHLDFFYNGLTQEDRLFSGALPIKV